MQSDGVIGLAPYGDGSLVDQLWDSKKIDLNIVTLNMNYWPGYHDNLVDVIVFGGVPEELAVLDTHTFPHSRVVD